MKKIGFWSALALVVGNIIGVGIFTTSGYLTARIQQSNLIMLAWFIGGIYALCGGFVYGFLAQEMPRRGGDYVYLKTYLHPYFGYLFGWSGLWITYTGSIAALSLGAAHYFFDILPAGLLISSASSAFQLKSIGLLFLFLFTLINHYGIRSGGKTQIGLSLLIVVGMIVFIVFGYFAAPHMVKPAPISGQSITLNRFFSGLSAVLFTYMGWTTVVYIADEVKNPKKNIPAAIVSGVLLITALYLAVNFVFLRILTPLQMANKVNVASLVANRLWGVHATQLIAVVIIIAILSSLNSTILSGPRIYQAMARDGYLWHGLAQLHKKYGTPTSALWVQAAWAAVLLLSGTFNQLLSFVVGAILIFSILSALVMVRILIRSHTNSWSKWFTVIIYILLCLLVLITILITQFWQTILGLLILSTSIPFYFFQEKKKIGREHESMRS